MSIEQWNNRSSFLLGADLVYSPLFEINSEGAFLKKFKPIPRIARILVFRTEKNALRKICVSGTVLMFQIHRNPQLMHT